jgi:hypothetical protein
LKRSGANSMDDQKTPAAPAKQTTQTPPIPLEERARLPVPNYSLSTVCPACDAPTYRLACKVRCSRCGFHWDCSEL